VIGPVAFDKLCDAACAAVRTYSSPSSRAHNAWAVLPCARCRAPLRDVMQAPRTVVVQLSNVDVDTLLAGVFQACVRTLGGCDFTFHTEFLGACESR